MKRESEGVEARVAQQCWWPPPACDLQGGNIEEARASCERGETDDAAVLHTLHSIAPINLLRQLLSLFQRKLGRGGVSIALDFIGIHRKKKLARFRAPTPPYKPSRALFFALCTPLPSLSAPSSPLAPPRRGATTSASYIFWRQPRSDNSRTTLGQRGFRPYNARLTFAGALFLQEGSLVGARQRDERSPRAVGPQRGKFAVLGAGAGHHGYRRLIGKWRGSGRGERRSGGQEGRPGE